MLGELKDAATRCDFETRMAVCVKMCLRPGLRMGPAGGAYSAPPGPLDGFGEGVGRNGKGLGMERERDGKEKKGKEGE